MESTYTYALYVNIHVHVFVPNRHSTDVNGSVYAVVTRRIQSITANPYSNPEGGATWGNATPFANRHNRQKSRRCVNDLKTCPLDKQVYIECVFLRSQTKGALKGSRNQPCMKWSVTHKTKYRRVGLKL